MNAKELLQQANKDGISIAEIAEVIKWDAARLYRYRKGIMQPFPHTYDKMKNAIDELRLAKK